MLYEGTPIDPMCEEELFIAQELLMRKAEVITQLNDIYAKDQLDDDQLDDGSDDSALTHQ
jgi:hypothetical protein